MKMCLKCACCLQKNRNGSQAIFQDIAEDFDLLRPQPCMTSTREVTLLHTLQGGTQPLSVTFPGPVPLQEYFDIIDSRFEQRLRQRSYREMLSQRAQQFRAIQRRLLTRFKDKTPTPLQNMDTLLEGTYQQVKI